MLAKSNTHQDEETKGSSSFNNPNDYMKMREITEKYHEGFMSDLEIFDLLNPNAPYSLDRCLNL